MTRPCDSDKPAARQEDPATDGVGSSRALGPVWLRILIVLALVALLAVPLVLWKDELARIFASREQVAAEVRAAGAWGPLVLIALIVGQTIVAPIPGQVINFVAGYIYGLVPGLLFSWLGLVAGTTIAMALARFAGRPVVARLVDPKVLDRLDRLAQGRGLGFFFLFFLIPGLPDDVLCFVAGLTTLPLRVLILLSATARIPGLVAAVWLGAYAERLPWPVYLLGGVLGGLAVWVAWRHGERIEGWLMRLTDWRR